MWISKLILSIKTEFLLLHRKYWTYLIFLVITLYYLKRSHAELVLLGPGQALHNSYFFVQAGIFVFLFLGILVMQSEQLNNVYEVIQSIHNALLFKIVSKVIFILILATLYCSVNAIALFVLYWLNNVPYIFIPINLPYILLYWIIPFMITGIIGIFVGATIRSKAVFPVAILLGILLGPLNNITYISVTKSLSKNLEQLMFMLNLGQSDYNRAYNTVYGYPTESFRFMTKYIFLFVMLMLTINIAIYKANHKRGRLGVIISAPISILLLLLSWNLFSPHLSEMTSKQAIRSENRYYQNLEEANNFSSDSFTVTSYEMSVNINDKFENHVRIEIKPLTQTSKITFTLYHGFVVQEVVRNEKREEFNQQGDHFEVNFSEQLNKGETYLLDIYYKGDAPSNLFANSHAVLLPNYLAWYPVSGKQMIAEYVESSFVRFYPNPVKEEVKFTLNYTGPAPLHTNLRRVSEDHWADTSSSGVTLVSGAVENVIVDDINVVLPYALYEAKNNLPETISALKDFVQDIRSKFNIHGKPLEQLFLVETRDSSFFPMWSGDTDLILNVSITSNGPNLLKIDEDMVSKVLAATVRNYNWERQDETMKRLFIYGYSYWFSVSNNLSQEKDTFYVHHLYEDIESYRPKYSIFMKELLEFMKTNKANETKLQEFYSNWLSLLQSSKELDISSALKLLNKVKGD